MTRSWTLAMGSLVLARQFGAGKFALGILECIDVLGDALCYGIEPNHLGWEIDEVDQVEAVTVVIEDAEECGSGDRVVEPLGFF